MNVEDLDTAIGMCEMCGRERIRFVHCMEHKDHAPLMVGCVCAEKMSDDYEGPKQRETKLKNRASRKARWLDRQWSISRKGNPFLKIDGLCITIFQQGNLWKYCVGKNNFSPKSYATIEEAKLAAFDEYWKQSNESG